MKKERKSRLRTKYQNIKEQYSQENLIVDCTPTAAEQLEKQGYEIVAKVGKTYQHIRVPKGKNVDDVFLEILEIPGVNNVELDVYYPLILPPTDPLFVNGDQTQYLQMVDIDGIWDLFTTWEFPLATPLLAWIDSAFGDLGHEDMQGTFRLPGYNAYDGSTNILSTPTMDLMNQIHGTATSGVAGALSNNGLGIAGLAFPSVGNIFPIRCARELVAGLSVLYAAQGLTKAVEIGAKIINMSLFISESDAMTQVMEEAMQHGCIVCAGAGNTVSSVGGSPLCLLPGVVGVSGINYSDNIISDGSHYFEGTDFCAPITILAPYKPLGEPSGYFAASGTSISTPIVTSLFALLLAVDDTLTRQEAYDIIADTCIPETPPLGSQQYGNGIVQFTSAISMAMDIKRAREQLPVDKTLLNSAIAAANLLVEEDYTVESWAVLTSALGAATTVANNANATQNEVNVAYLALIAAIDSLELKEIIVPVDKTLLNSTIATAQLLNSVDYTLDSWLVFEGALNAAEIIAADNNATQIAVDAALAELVSAMEALILKDDEGKEMDIFTTKTYRVIDNTKIPLSCLARVLRADGGIHFNGYVSAMTLSDITITGKYANGTPGTLKFTAKQLYENDYVSFLMTEDMDEVWPESDRDVTKEQVDTIFDVLITRQDQFAQYTLDGVRYTNAVVRTISETAISLVTSRGNANISIPQAKAPTFYIVFSDTLCDSRTLFTVTANGNATTATTALTLTFNREPTDLTAAQITVTGGTKGALTGTGNTRTLAFTPTTSGIATVSITNSEIETGVKNVQVFVPVATFTVTANGNSSTATTSLTFTFNRAPVNLTADQITVSAGAKGTLSGSGTTRTLLFTPTATANITVSINNPDVETGNKTVQVYQPVALATFTVAANGNATTSTTQLTLTFNRAPTNLTAAQIDVTGGTKGTLGGSGTTRTLAFTPSASGTATVKINNSDVEATTKNVQVYLVVVPATFTVTANGNSTTATTQLTFTFNRAPTTLTVGQINVSSGTKGTLSGSGTTRTLTFTPAASGSITVSISNSDVESGNKTVQVYKPATVPMAYQGWSLATTAAALTETQIKAGNEIPDTGSGSLHFVQMPGEAYWFFATRRAQASRISAYLEAISQTFEWYPYDGSRMNTAQKVIDGFTYYVYQITPGGVSGAFNMDVDF